MAICDLCNKEMKTATSCTVEALHADGERVALLTFGNEPGWRQRSGRCGDCGVEVGGLHHLGCDIQCCPCCGGQLISCGCRWDELPETWEDGDDDGGTWFPTPDGRHRAGFRWTRCAAYVAAANSGLASRDADWLVPTLSDPS